MSDADWDEDSYDEEFYAYGHDDIYDDLYDIQSENSSFYDFVNDDDFTAEPSATFTILANRRMTDSPGSESPEGSLLNGIDASEIQRQVSGIARASKDEHLQPETLMKTCCRYLGRHFPYELIETHQPAFSEPILIDILKYNLPDNSEDIDTVLGLCGTQSQSPIEISGDVKLIKQIGTVLYGQVHGRNGNEKIQVHVYGDRGIITRVHCSDCKKAYCSHVQSVIQYHLAYPDKVPRFLPVSDYLNELSRDDLQLLVQNVLQKNRDSCFLESVSRVAIELASEGSGKVCAGPDFTAGASMNSTAAWYISMRKFKKKLRFLPGDIFHVWAKLHLSSSESDRILKSFSAPDLRNFLMEMTNWFQAISKNHSSGWESKTDVLRSLKILIEAGNGCVIDPLEALFVKLIDVNGFSADHGMVVAPDTTEKATPTLHPSDDQLTFLDTTSFLWVCFLRARSYKEDVKRDLVSKLEDLSVVNNLTVEYCGRRIPWEGFHFIINLAQIGAIEKLDFCSAFVYLTQGNRSVTLDDVCFIIRAENEVDPRSQPLMPMLVPLLETRLSAIANNIVQSGPLNIMGASVWSVAFLISRLNDSDLKDHLLYVLVGSFLGLTFISPSDIAWIKFSLSQLKCLDTRKLSFCKDSEQCKVVTASIGVISELLTTKSSFDRALLYSNLDSFAHNIDFMGMFKERVLRNFISLLLVAFDALPLIQCSDQPSKSSKLDDFVHTVERVLMIYRISQVEDTLCYADAAFLLAHCSVCQLMESSHQQSQEIVIAKLRVCSLLFLKGLHACQELRKSKNYSGTHFKSFTDYIFNLAIFNQEGNSNTFRIFFETFSKPEYNVKSIFTAYEIMELSEFFKDSDGYDEPNANFRSLIRNNILLKSVAELTLERGNLDFPGKDLERGQINSILKQIESTCHQQNRWTLACFLIEISETLVMVPDCLNYYSGQLVLNPQVVKLCSTFISQQNGSVVDPTIVPRSTVNCPQYFVKNRAIVFIMVNILVSMARHCGAAPISRSSRSGSSRMLESLTAAHNPTVKNFYEVCRKHVGAFQRAYKQAVTRIVSLDNLPTYSQQHGSPRVLLEAIKSNPVLSDALSVNGILYNYICPQPTSGGPSAGAGPGANQRPGGSSANHRHSHRGGGGDSFGFQHHW